MSLDHDPKSFDANEALRELLAHARIAAQRDAAIDALTHRVAALEAALAQAQAHIATLQQPGSPTREPRAARPTPAEEHTLLGAYSSVRDYRCARGLTQAELAAHLGVSLRTVLRWESGQSQPRESVLKTLGLLAQQH